MHDGEELVEEPFRRLIGEGRLMAYPHDGFWACMDTFKEKQDLEDVFGRGSAPWAVWNASPRNQEMIACNLSGMKRRRAEYDPLAEQSESTYAAFARCPKNSETTLYQSAFMTIDKYCFDANPTQNA